MAFINIVRDLVLAGCRPETVEGLRPPAQLQPLPEALRREPL